MQDTDIPEGWTATTLGKVIIKVQDKINISELNKWNYISTENMFPNIGGTTEAATLPTISSVSKFQIGDILFSNIRTYFKKLWFSDKVGGASNDVLIFRGDDNQIKKEFLFYLLSDNKFFDYTVKTSKGTKMPRGDKDAIEKYPILLPSIPEQKEIASILSSFDDKVEILRKQNQTLEEIAQTIFQEWFFLNSEIRKQRLGDLMTVKRGGSPRPIQDYISEKGLRWLKISDATATEGPFVFNIKECIKEEGLRKTIHLEAGSLVLSNSATPGMPKILAVDSCIHDGWLYFPKSNFSNEFLYLLFQEIRPQLIQQGSGSVFTNLKTDILKDFEAPLPSNEMLDKFDEIVKPIFQKIFNNSSEIRILSKARDELLPKLMKDGINGFNP